MVRGCFWFKYNYEWVGVFVNVVYKVSVDYIVFYFFFGGVVLYGWYCNVLLNILFCKVCGSFLESG